MKKVIKKVASKKPMMQKGGVKKPLRKAQTGTATGTPFQQYMKTPGAVASDTIVKSSYTTPESLKLARTTGDSPRYYDKPIYPSAKNPKNQKALDKARDKTYGVDRYFEGTPNKDETIEQYMRRMGPMKKGGSVKKMQTGGAKERAQKVIDQKNLEYIRKYAKMKQDKGLVPDPTPIDKKYDTPQYYGAYKRTTYTYPDSQKNKGNEGSVSSVAKKATAVAKKKMAKGGTAHPGFKAVQAGIAAKQGISKQAAGAILASATRKASAKAKAANPRLKRVKG